ncbi:alginate export family protein [Nitrosomonas sp. Is37]|uniref:alginate export family protein n=1 Tax=Nitrosomonas sp. Is37 TaxID=3080535 RepID=UPI00294B1D95|nr:alginate export family protein [Nitrosomonas sp. Is37]MDV6343415.1 alginate export family protein [Nitrosomonas sp. Is37]
MIFQIVKFHQKVVSVTEKLLQLLIIYNAVGALLQTSEVFAQEDKAFGQINKYFRINGEFMGSYELWDFFRPEPAINNNNSYDLWVLRARLGALLTTPYVDGYVQGQYIGLYGLPDNAVAKPGGSLGLGAGYFQLNQSTNISNIYLNQGYLNFKFGSLGLPGASLKAGRFAYMEGMEYSSGVDKFDGLKQRRIAQRLIGGFNAVYIGRSFDGISAIYDKPAFNWTISGVRPTQGILSVEGQKQISDINIFYTALTSKKDVLLPGTEARLFYINYDDKRNTQVVDNRPLAARPRLNNERLNIHTLGTHLLSLHQFESGSLDALLWSVYQFGDWTDQKHEAWAVSAELGYQWIKLPFKPWLRAIYYQSSGDGNPGDNKHQTFFSMVPSGRIFAKFPFYNLMNIQDLFLEIIASPAPKTQVNINLHQLSLTNSHDLIYRGLGASLNSGEFGYSGSPAGGNSDVGQLVDISLMHTFNKHLSLRLYYGHAFGGSVIKNNFQGKKNANSFWADFNLVF